MSPDTADNIIRIAKFVVGSTMAYVVLCVVWAWMKSEDDRLDAEAEAFKAGHEAGRRRHGLAESLERWRQERREERDRPSRERHLRRRN